MSTDPSSADVKQASAQTWAALLAHWTNFARAAVALPKDAEGDRWRASVPAIIGLQAVTMALGELDNLASASGAAGEYEVGVDRASVLVREHAGAINAAWRGELLPSGILELLEDARAALALVREAGTEVIATEAGAASDPAAALRALRAAGFEGEFYAMPPGETEAPGLPVAFAKSPKGAPLGADQLAALASSYPGRQVRRAPIMRQVYERTDASGSRERVLAAMDDTLPSGRPLLGLIGP